MPGCGLRRGDVGGAAHDDAGDGQAADGAGDHVGRALADHLAIELVRGPVCMRSTDTAESRLSTLAIRATVSTPAANAPQLPSGRLGRASASSREPLIWMRVTSLNGASRRQRRDADDGHQRTGHLLDGLGRPAPPHQDGDHQRTQHDAVHRGR